MPYLFEKKKIKKEDDKRIKLSDSDKQLIRSLYAEGGTSQRKLALDFGVSRRSIQFVLDPQKQKENYQRRLERGGSKQYYDTAKRKNYMKSHREHKRKLFIEGKLDEN